MEKIEAILKSYDKSDTVLFRKTVEELCSKGIGKGVFQDYKMLSDIIDILYKCSNVIENN